MPFKKTLLGIEARDKLIEGADFLAEAVKPTMGPFGQNHLLEKGSKITNDGVSIARELEMKDVHAHKGLALLREAAIKTESEASDGTTTAIVLGHAILKEAVKFMPKDSAAKGKKTVADILKTLDTECKEVIEKLKVMATPIESEEQLINSARVSVDDEELGKLIGSAQWKIGKEGVLLAEESNDQESSVEHINGIRIDNGLSSTGVINNQEKQSLDAGKSKIILTNHVINSLIPLKPTYDLLAASGVKSLVIVARAFSEVALKHVMDNIKVGFMIYPINAPYVDQNEVMKDLSALTGARYINTEETDIESLQLSDVGDIERMIARRYDATFTGFEDEKAKERIDNRIKEIQEKLKGEPSFFAKKNLETRLAQFTSGFAIIKVGSISEVERKRVKDKIDDAVGAVRGAFQEGVVAGAGIALKEISEGLPDTYILKRPLLAVYQQIMASAPEGFIVEDWVRDPVRVLRVALEKACSVAGNLATANGVTATEREKPRMVQEVTKDEEDSE